MLRISVHGFTRSLPDPCPPSRLRRSVQQSRCAARSSPAVQREVQRFVRQLEAKVPGGASVRRQLRAAIRSVFALLVSSVQMRYWMTCGGEPFLSGKEDVFGQNWVQFSCCLEVGTLILIRNRRARFSVFVRDGMLPRKITWAHPLPPIQW